MNNLFNFSYKSTQLFNNDGTASNFRQVFGENGITIGCPKSSYHIVETEDVSTLGQTFIDKGYDVSTFVHRNGEKIGLNVDFGQKLSKVGDVKNNLLITIPNNNSGKGFLSIKQTRLICTNGMVSTGLLFKDQSIKIPHTFDYKINLKLMAESINAFDSIIGQLSDIDNALNGKKIDINTARFELNKWFYFNELPTSQRTMSFNEFRKMLAFDEREELKSINRYDELMLAFNRELDHNSELKLDLTYYTVYATVTNYLSRRIESSNSTASNEIQFSRASTKLKSILELI